MFYHHYFVVAVHLHSFPPFFLLFLFSFLSQLIILPRLGGSSLNIGRVLNIGCISSVFPFLGPFPSASSYSSHYVHFRMFRFDWGLGFYDPLQQASKSCREMVADFRCRLLVSLPSLRISFTAAHLTSSWRSLSSSVPVWLLLFARWR